jgi:predicted amidophosphoribosyltransferase
MAELECPHCKNDVDFGPTVWAVSSDKTICEHCGEAFVVEHDCFPDTEDGESGCFEYLSKPNA